MATNELNTRIILKNDDAVNWNNSSLTLKKGEVGIVFGRPASQSGTQTTMLVGNGSTNLDLYAKASDVYSWAKASTKPTYSASEISGMTDYVTTDSLTTTLSDYVTGTTLTQEISASITTNNNKAPTYVDLTSYCTNEYVASGTSNDAYLWVKNGWVTIVGNRRVPSGDNSWGTGTYHTIINLPSEYQPSRIIEFSVGSKTSITNLGITGRITTDGIIQLRQAGGGQNFLSSFCVTYPI